MNDCVLSYHTNGFGCGVAKFSRQLAERLGVPFRVYGSPAHHPLISVKFTEVGASAPDPTFYYPAYDLFLHDSPQTSTQRIWARNADHVYVADPAIQVKGATVLWCPSTIQGEASRGSLRVLLFGMAHKIQRTYYERLAALLMGVRGSYTVSLSTGVHEGHPWDDTFARTHDAAKQAFGDKLRLLGYLADDALALELRHASVVGLFFEPAARANNTTLWAALEARCPVITNLDAQSPPELVHQETVFDIAQLEQFPMSALVRVGRQGAEAAQGRGWAHLLDAMQVVTVCER